MTIYNITHSIIIHAKWVLRHDGKARVLRLQMWKKARNMEK